MKIFLVILGALIFVSCSSQKVSEINNYTKAEFTPYIVNLENNRAKVRGEITKCMSGVSLYREFNFNNIGDFERKTGTNNDVYITKMQEEDEFPASFIIECVSKGKKPFLFISHNITNIEDVAKKCNCLSSNMFVAIEYSNIEEYSNKAKIFRQYAPSSVLVFPIDDKNIGVPQENLYDWIMINCNEKISENIINTQINELRNKIKYFSQNAVVLNVSIENFSEDNYKYYTTQWNNEIKEIYSLANDYENIGMICYNNNSSINRSEGSSRISESKSLWTGFANAKNILPNERKWLSTDKIAYVSSDNIAYVKNYDANILNIKGKYANNQFVTFKNYSIDESNRKMFVYLSEML